MVLFFINIILILSCYLYFYFGYILILVLPKKLVLSYYSYFLNYLHNIVKITNIYKKIRIIGNIKNNNNLLIFNHSSVFDNLLIGYILTRNNINYLQLKTVSKESRNIQNKINQYLGHLLINKNPKNDIVKLRKINNNWKKINNINVILFPEGTIVTEKNLLKSKFDYLLSPKIGIYNNLVNFISFKNVYDITFCFSLNGKKILGERNILGNISHPNIRIDIIITDVTKQHKQNNFLYTLWENKDKMIDSILKK